MVTTILKPFMHRIIIRWLYYPKDNSCWFLKVLLNIKFFILQDPSGRFIVLYTFIARDENDVSVERGEFVTVLNREDPDWYWIVRSDGQEGFVPSGFVYPADVIQGHLNQMDSNQNNNTTNHNTTTPPTAPHHLTTAANDDLRYHGTELVMLYDYKVSFIDRG